MTLKLSQIQPGADQGMHIPDIRKRMWKCWDAKVYRLKARGGVLPPLLDLLRWVDTFPYFRDNLYSLALHIWQVQVSALPVRTLWPWETESPVEATLAVSSLSGGSVAPWELVFTVFLGDPGSKILGAEVHWLLLVISHRCPCLTLILYNYFYWAIIYIKCMNLNITQL
jgi:hypothetical protein